ncbi:hypothetical protein E4T66_11040 [Sinimarinibacterium sp. CAU 1509]|uniref:hypothetical protein n=1 Tax=Sinimarinibacterium sp. CAU 1509 TaxID=2562283 RepID=UPI0010ACC90B|nr:hypothetical protein [Sinimarinibacterium sp. CAU 1509]TJY61151.1 hypothetical protein E4T66_11040 [Sinimarinibacterium sp. CAU 1509]
MQASHGTAVSTAAAAKAEISTVHGDASGVFEDANPNNLGWLGTAPITFGDIVLGVCAVVGTLVVIVDAWSAWI